MAALCGVGLSTANFAPRLRDLGRALDWFEELGLDWVELSLMAFEVIGGNRIYPDRLAELKRICAGRPLRYTVHGPISSNFGDPDHLALQMDCCRACLEVSGELGATAQVHHSAILPHLSAAHRADRLKLERDALAEMAGPAAAAGVVLCVETLFGRIVKWSASPVELAAQIRAVDHPNIRACIDFSHTYINAGERGFDPLAELAELAPLTRHLHIHDSFGLPNSFLPYNADEAIGFGIGDIHLPPGRGDLPWDALAKLPYAGETVANLELSDRHRDQVADAVAWTRAWIGMVNGGYQPA